ncbi:MAG: DUF885 family protein [Bacillota bacterium]
MFKTWGQWDSFLAALVWEYEGSWDYEEQLFVPRPSAVEEYTGRLASARRNLLKTRPGSAAGFAFRHHCLDLLATAQATVESDQEQPHRHLVKLGRRVAFLATKDSRALPQRARVLAALLADVPEYLEVVAGLCRQLPQCQVAHATRACRVAAIELERVQNEVERWSDRGVEPRLVARICRQAVDGVGRLEALAGGICPVGPASPTAAGVRYAELLDALFGIDVQELVSGHRHEVERTRDRVARLAAGIAPGQPVPDLLLEELPPYADATSMFSAAREFLATARRESLPYVRLPEGEQCLITGVPEAARDSFPWGGYGGGCPRRVPLIGEMFLNEANFPAVTRGWLQMMAIHEGYPGHHVQWLKRVGGSLPLTVRLPGRCTPLVEGAAHRSEELLQEVFPDRAFPLFVAYRQLHTALRVQADLELHYYGRPVEEVCGLYQDVLGFSPASARAQVVYQERNPGYMTCYYHGYRALQELERSSGLEARDFTEFIFSCGSISLQTLQALLEGGPEVRAQWLSGSFGQEEAQ